MIIAHLTDLHIGFDGPNETCKNSARLERTLASLDTMQAKADILLITGDLIETGEEWAYRKLKEALGRVKVPTYFAMGNHDNRQAFASAFPDASFNEGFLQYSVEVHPLRIIVVDTLEPGRHGGAFCESRAAWLSRELAKAPEQPTLIAMHHPPIETGIDWMTAHDDDDWVVRFKSVIEANPQVVQIISGHVHRSIFKGFAGTHVSVSLAVAPQVALELAELHVDTPDGRPLLVDGAPGYCLLHWDGTHVTTHHTLSEQGRPIVNYDKDHAFIVRRTQDLDPKP